MGFVFLLSLLGASAAAMALVGGDDADTDTDDAPGPDSRPDTQPDTRPDGGANSGTNTTPNLADDSGTDTTAANTAVQAPTWVPGGTNGPDIRALSGSQGFYGLAGQDTITASGRSIAYGNTGADELTLSDRSTGYGGFGGDTIFANDNSTAWGGAGDDRIQATNGANANGDAGDDRLFWSPTAAQPSGHSVRLSGGAGDDLISVWSQTEGRIDAAGGIGRDLILAGDGVQALGSFGADTLIGADGSILIGGQGADTFIASANAQFSRSDEAITIRDFVKGTDTLAVHLIAPPGPIDLTEADGNTVLTMNWTAEGDTTPAPTTVVIRGVTGLTLDDFDFVTEANFFEGPDGDIIVNTGTTYSGATIGTAAADRITVPDGRSLVATGAGNDAVTGRSTNADGLIDLGFGNDTYTAIGALDDVAGGAGNDSILYTIGPNPASNTASVVNFDTGAGNDIVQITAPAAGSPTAPGPRFDITLGSGNDILTVDRDANRQVTVFDDAGDDRMSIWMGDEAIMFGAGADLLTIGIDSDHFATRGAAQIFELGTTDRVVIEVEAGITSAVEFIQFPGTGEGDPVTVLRLGDKDIVRFNDLIAANDPRITITRNATFA